MNANDGALASRDQVLASIAEDSRFVLATHEHPDGDALGSLVAMQELLRSLGKDSLMFVSYDDLPLPSEYSLFLLEGAIHVPPADIAERTVVFLDCGNIDRNSASVLRDGTRLLNIDHHHDNTRFGTVNHVVPDASCTAEVVWDLMHGLGAHPSTMAAQAMYIGLITDTGRFMYENTGPRAHLMAAELIEAGVDVAAVYRHLYEDTPPEKLALMALALAQMQRFDGGELTLTSLSAEDFERTEAEEHYSEGVVDQLRAVRGTKVAAFVRAVLSGERRGQHKVSLRAADDDVDVSVIARAQGGGGHRRAAGFSTTLSVDELIDFLRPAVAAQLHASDGHAAPTLA
ncbi:MAG TPA: DHH family phosphoesterase [Solirubrobacteraceae bacterium]|nr:DHH family phosphoesterase [Solirubrobacteraceae bacterium]